MKLGDDVAGEVRTVKKETKPGAIVPFVIVIEAGPTTVGRFVVAITPFGAPM
jgi:hypothetical protein